MFPDYVMDYLTSIGFELETDNRLSFVPEYKWEKFSLIITACNHYSFKIYEAGKVIPKRVIFSGFRIANKEELIYLLSNNADFSNLYEKQAKTSLHL